MAPFILGAGGENDNLALKLSTCTRKHINNERPLEKAPLTLQASLEMDKKTNPKASLVSAPTATYNCMGLVFASRRTCIDISELNFILGEDSYRQLAGLHEAMTGDVVCYQKDGKIEHVGLINSTISDCRNGSIQATVVSKWGMHAEYIHDMCDVPSHFGSPKFFWTHRKLPP